MRNIVICLLLLVALVAGVLPINPVYAATQTRAVAGEGSQTDGSYVGGAADYTVLNSDDDEASYNLLEVYTGTGIKYHCWDFQDFS